MRAQITCNQEVFSAVAKELGVSIAEVKQIYNAQSLFIKQTMESNTFDGVRWPYFGVFRSKPQEVQIINHLKGLLKDQKSVFMQTLKYNAQKQRLQKELDQQQLNNENKQHSITDPGPDQLSRPLQSENHL